MSPRSRLLVALLSTGLVAYVALGAVLGRVMGDTTYGQLAVFNEVIRLVLEAYVDPVNLDRTMDGARLGLTDALDGDSAYLDPEELKAYQQPPRDLEADLGIVLARRFAFLAVVAPRANSPADKAGIRPGDIIKTIDGRHTRGLSVAMGERLLRGAPGSVVKLQLFRSGADLVEVSVVRERLAAEPPHGKLLEGGAGYLRIAEFSQRTAEEVRGELEALRRGGAVRLVLDLRRSAHGVPADGIATAELFKEGVLARLVGRRVPEKTWAAAPGRVAWSLPLAVLVDGSTAGAAEVVAAALLDAGRPVVGQRTFGRAPVQKLVTLPEGGLLLTVAKYVSPEGKPIHGKGVEPTAPVPAPDEEEAVEGAAPRDPVLEKALELLGGEVKKAA